MNTILFILMLALAGLLVWNVYKLQQMIRQDEMTETQLAKIKKQAARMILLLALFMGLYIFIL